MQAHLEIAASIPLHTRHAAAFPAALLGLAREQGVRQLELSLSQGRWVSSRLQHRATPQLCTHFHPPCMPPADRHLPPLLLSQDSEQLQHVAAAAAWPKPPGLEVKVVFGSETADTQAAYGIVTQALGGLLCAGVATAPQLAVMAVPAVGWFSHQPPAVAAAAPRQAQERQVYAWLPQEALCSENLAAWRRLLPCRQAAGLAALLQPVQLAASPYYSLGLQLQVSHPAAAGGGSQAAQPQPQLHLRLVLTAVLPPQQAQQGLVEALFGRGLPPACPAARSSMIYVAHPAPGSPANSSCSLQETAAGPLLACDAIQPQLRLPRSAAWHAAAGSSGGHAATAARLQVVQHAVQRGSQAGTLLVGVRVPVAPHPGEQQGQLLHVMQLLPWQLPVDAAAVQLSRNGQVSTTRGLPGCLPVLQWLRPPCHAAEPAYLRALPAAGSAAVQP